MITTILIGITYSAGDVWNLPGPLANIFGWFFTAQVVKYTQGFKMKNKQR